MSKKLATPQISVCPNCGEILEFTEPVVACPECGSDIWLCAACSAHPQACSTCVEAGNFKEAVFRLVRYQWVPKAQAFRYKEMVSGETGTAVFADERDFIEYWQHKEPKALRTVFQKVEEGGLL